MNSSFFNFCNTYTFMNKFNIQPFTRHYKALEKDYSLES